MSLHRLSSVAFRRQVRAVTAPGHRGGWAWGQHLRAAPALALLGLGCGTPPAPPGIMALHTLPGSAAARPDDDFFSLPFPSDLRLRAPASAPLTPAAPSEAELQAGYDLKEFPRPPGQPGRYVSLLDGQLPGAGTSAAVYFRFAGPLDEQTLPRDAAASIAVGASAYLVDITPSSPTYGQRAPASARFHREENRFIGPNWLSLLPLPGAPLRQLTTYAAIVTAGVRAQTGGAVQRHPDLELLLQSTQPTAEPHRTAWLRYAPLRAYLEQNSAEQVVAATVFTTQNATALMGKLRAAVYAKVAPPEPENLSYLRSHDGLCDIYQGTFASPNFQSGDPPYWAEGGQIELDAQGQPNPTRSEKLRFALSVPTAEMPAAGWPVVLYAHGTGGDYLTFVRETMDVRAAYIEHPEAPGSPPQPPVRMAMISIDQVLHGPRDPTGNNPDITFFNLNNLPAARDHVKQGAADDFQLLRLVEKMNIARAPQTGRPIRFDPSRIYFVGHSQGGLTGPLFLAAEPKVQAGVLSGAGAVLILSLLNKTAPQDIAALVESLLQETPSPEHPMLNLLQTYFESSDPGNYGPLLFREPPAGSPPKSIFQTLGVGDHYPPNPHIAAFALSLGVQPLEPRLYELAGLELTAQRWTTGPVQGNVAGGRATAALRQYIPPGDDDGHFVIFDLWAARHTWTRFLASKSLTGTAVIQ
jgi:predicted esterase